MYWDKKLEETAEPDKTHVWIMLNCSRCMKTAMFIPVYKGNNIYDFLLPCLRKPSRTEPQRKELAPFGANSPFEELTDFDKGKKVPFHVKTI